MKTSMMLALVVVALAATSACQTAQSKKMRLAPADRYADVHSTGSLKKAPLPLTLYFETDAVTLDQASMSALDAWGDYLRHHRDARLTITGHADDRGTTEYNLGLGAARAFTARRYLITLGAKPEQIEVTSFGEERPVLADGSEDARAKNRRDELSISFVSPSTASTASTASTSNNAGG